MYIYIYTHMCIYIYTYITNSPHSLLVLVCHMKAECG